MFDLSSDTANIKFTDCGKSLRFRGGKYGRFLSCSGFPDCKFAFNPEFKDPPDIFCLKCNKTLELETIEDNKYLTCEGSPNAISNLNGLIQRRTLQKKLIILNALIATVN